MNIVKLKISWRILDLSFIHDDFQNLILKRCFLLVLDPFFSRDSPLLFSSNLFLQVILTVFFGKELLTFNLLKFS